VLPEQGQSLGSLVCSRASSRRHGAATSSAQACRLGYLILSADRGFSPAPVATADGDAIPARLAVATAHARAGIPRNVPVCQPIPAAS
jgi:hypothetical protein